MRIALKIAMGCTALAMLDLPAAADDTDVFTQACTIKRQANQKTNLQTEHAYKRLIGLSAKVTFRAMKVYEAMLSDYAIDGVAKCGIRISCMIDSADVSELLAISKGDEISCSGTASSVSGTSIWLKDSIVTR